MTTKLLLQIVILIIVTAGCLSGIITSCYHYSNKETELMLSRGYRWVPSSPARTGHWEEKAQ